MEKTTKKLKVEEIEKEEVEIEIGVELIFILSEIAEKIDFQFPEEEDHQEIIKSMREDGKTDEEIERKLKKLNKKFSRDIILELFKKLHRVREDVEELIKIVSGRDANEMSIKELKDILMQIISKDGILNFFK